MTHLTDEQIVDAAEGAPPQAHAAHLSTCATCASKVREIQAVLLEVDGVDAPEPSPLFWQQLPVRVRAAIDRPQSGRIGWRLPWVAASAAALVVMVAFAILGIRFGDVRQPTAAVRPTPEPAAPAEPVAVVETLDIDEDEAWAVVRSLAADLHYDDANEAGVVPRADAVDRAATELPEDERAQLIRMIEEDLGHRRTEEPR